jgi:hypothetical protein
MRSQEDPDRHPENEPRSNGRHYQSHRGPTPFLGNHVGNNRKDQRSQHAAKATGDRAARQEQWIIRSEGAEERAKAETGIDSKKHLFSIHSTQEDAEEYTRQPCADAIRGNHQSELC